MTTKPWWQDAVIYQVYLKSFYDSNGDGIGDLPGLIQKLPYIQSLGAKAIWLCPIYPSPGADNGYDVADYTDIDPCYGTLADFDQLVKQARALGIRIIMDLVVNHTSTSHRWFKEARKKKSSPFRDFYLWAPAAGADEAGNPLLPNNWMSEFGGSAWEFDRKSGEYYLHTFAKEQADLNWHNPIVRREMARIVKFWKARGVAGFRVDAVNLISKPDVSQQDPARFEDPLGSSVAFLAEGPMVHPWLQELGEQGFYAPVEPALLNPYADEDAELDADGEVVGPPPGWEPEYGVVEPDIFVMGEANGTTAEQAWQYVDPQRREFSALIHFDLMTLDQDSQSPLGKWSQAPFDVAATKKRIAHWQEQLAGRGFQALYWENHDQPRLKSRLALNPPVGACPDQLDEIYRELVTTLYASPGVKLLYQGQELGMTNTVFSKLSQMHDVDALQFYRERTKAGELTRSQALAAINAKGRDHARTPMQWDDSPHAGFTTGTPWLEVNPNYETLNVAAQENDPESLLNWYRQLFRDQPVNASAAKAQDDAVDVVAFVKDPLAAAAIPSFKRPQEKKKKKKRRRK